MTSDEIRNNIRYNLLKETGTTANEVLSDGYIDLMYSDAQTLSAQTDVLALRWYTCFLIAETWIGLDHVESREGVKYRVPKPDNFLKFYQGRIDGLSDSDDEFEMAKVAINKDTEFNDDHELVRNDC